LHRRGGWPQTALVTEFYRLYGAEVSYFTAKIRPALRAKGVRFAELIATAAVYRDVIRPRTGLAFIPVVTTPDGEIWQDTSEILDRLEARVPEPALVPPSPFLRVAAALLEVYADEFLILPAMHYRWSFPESEAKARGDFVATNTDAAAAHRFADRMKGSIAALGVTPDSAAAIESHTRDLLVALESLFTEVPLLMGDRLSVADCALLGPFYAHLYLDVVPGRLLRATAPRVCGWIERANHPDPEAWGDWLDDVRAAELLRPLLSLVGRDAAPIILDSVRAVEAWADAQSSLDGDVPRGVGTHESALRGTPLRRFTGPYTLWMLQRPQAVYASLSDAERKRVDGWLAGTGLESWIAYRPRHRLGKKNFKLVFET
jgi:glutathione S-transferase